jgi:hypothetical protein
MTPKRIEIVKDRLDFITLLSKSKEIFRGDNLLKRHKHTDTHSHPYGHFSALRYYLCLTCFDILGQTEEYTDFYSWLNSSSHSKEREVIFKKCENLDFQVYISSVYREYNAIYGVSNSFYRFIHQILSSENQKKLFDSVDIKKQTKVEPKQVEYEPTIKKKVDFMYLVRNSFTHKGKPISSIMGGFHFVGFNEDEPSSYDANGTAMWSHAQVYTEHRQDFVYVYSVIKWPSILIEIIEDTIKNAETEKILE